MSKAIGMVEYKTVSAGITAADAMVKTSEVSIIEAQTVCPGKYIAIITGDLSAVKAAVDNAKEMHGLHRTSPSSRQSTVLHILKTYPLLVLWRHTMHLQLL